MAAPNPMDTQSFEMKCLELKRTDPKTPMGVTVDVKAPGCVMVKKILADSGAAKSGLQVGDIILFANGRTIFARSDLADAFSTSGTATSVTVARKRASPLGPPPLPKGKERKTDCNYLLFRLRKSAETDVKVEWVFVDGVISAKEVTPGGFGHTTGFKKGDRLVAVSGEAIRDVEHLKDLIAGGKGAPADLLIERPPLAKQPQATGSVPTSGGPFELELEPVSEPWVAQVVADPSIGVEPPPDDVQTIADQNRDALVEKIKPIKLQKSSKSKKETRVQISNSISVQPLKKEFKNWM